MHRRLWKPDSARGAELDPAIRACAPITLVLTPGMLRELLTVGNRQVCADSRSRSIRGVVAFWCASPAPAISGCCLRPLT